jgi:hypothetical protein
LGFLSPKNRFRQLVVQIICHPLFEGFILFIILLNAVLLAQADYSHVDSSNNLIADGSARNTALAVMNIPFLVVFTMECVLKIVGKGFVGWRGSYLGDYWNWLDIIIVITG